MLKKPPIQPLPEVEDESSRSSAELGGVEKEKEKQLFFREWSTSTLGPMLSQIPTKAQKGLTTLDLRLTCMASVEEYIVLGTNVGLVYWYNRKHDRLDRLKTEDTSLPILCLSVVSTVDFMVAAGNSEGRLTIFQISKLVKDNIGIRFINNNLLDATNHDIERFDIAGLHKCRLSCLEWSSNGMKLFSGDEGGIVVMTELDFELGKVKSRQIAKESVGIVQLSYFRKYLLICSKLQSVIYSLDGCASYKVGTQERKVLGKFGGTFLKSSFTDRIKLFSVRPGGRMWLADVSGMVEHTIKFKDLFVENNFSNIPLVSPSNTQQFKSDDFQIGLLHKLMTTFFVSFHNNALYILDPGNTRILGVCQELKGILDISVNPETDEIFVLESDRNVIRLSTSPDHFLSLSQSEFLKNIPYGKLMSSSIADFRSEMEQPLNFITTKIKETSKLVPKINSTLINTLKQVIEADVNIQDCETVIPLPPPSDMLEVASENYDSEFAPSNLQITVPDKFEHISHLPFDDVLLVPPKLKKKTKNGRKSRDKRLKDKVFQSSGDTVSISSSTYSTNSEEDANVNSCLTGVKKLSNLSAEQRIADPKQFLDMSKRWNAGGKVDVDNPDLEAKEEILARKLNWPELLPESRRAVVEFELIGLRMQKKVEEVKKLDSDEDVYEDSSSFLTLKDHESAKYSDQEHESSPKNRQNTPDQQDEQKVTQIQSNSPEVLEDVDDDSIDIYTKYAPKEEAHDDFSVPSAISFGPPSVTSNSLGSFPMEPKITEIHENSLPTSPIDLAPVRDMLVEPEVLVSDTWLSYCAPGPLQSIAACRKYVVAVDKKNQVYVSELGGSALTLRWVQTKYHAHQIAVSPCGSVFWRLYKGTLYSLMNPAPNTTIVEGAEWCKIHSSVAYVSIQRHVGWIVKQDGMVFICSGLLSTAVVPDFEKVPSHIAMSKVVADDEKVWGISQDGRLYCRKGVTEDRLRGSEWAEKHFETSLPFAPATISLGPSNTLWIGDVENNLYFVDGLIERGSYEGRPYHWKVTLRNFPIFSGGLERAESGATFSLSSLKHKLSDSFTSDRLASFFSSKGGAAGPSVCGTESSVWFSMPDSSKIYLNKTMIEGHRWCLLEVSRLFRSTNWVNVMGGGIYKDHGFLWLLDPKGKLFYCNPNGGDAKSIDLPCSAALSCVVPAPDALWLLNKEGVIYARENVCSVNPIGHGWARIDLSSQQSFHLVHVSCGSDVAWGCDQNGNMFIRIGSLKPPGANDISPAWNSVEDDPSVATSCIFTKVYVGTNGSMVWAIDMNNNIYVREAIFSDFLIGTKWLLVSGIEAVSLAISEKAVWALSPKGEIFCRVGITNTNFVGDYWKKIPGPNDAPVEVLTVSLCDEVCALDINHQLFKHSSHSLDLKMGDGSRTRFKTVLDPEDKEWVLVDSL